MSCSRSRPCCRWRRDVPDFEQVETERLDLRKHAEQRGAVFEHTGEHGLAALQLGLHRGKRRESGETEPALYPDRVQAQWRYHARILLPDQVSPRRRNPVITRTPPLPPRAATREEAELPCTLNGG